MKARLQLRPDRDALYVHVWKPLKLQGADGILKRLEQVLEVHAAWCEAVGQAEPLTFGEALNIGRLLDCPVPLFTPEELRKAARSAAGHDFLGPKGLEYTFRRPETVKEALRAAAKPRTGRTSQTMPVAGTRVTNRYGGQETEVDVAEIARQAMGARYGKS